MKLFLKIPALWLVLWLLGVSPGFTGEELTLDEVLGRQTYTLLSNSRDELKLEGRNQTATALTVTIPAGVIFRGSEPDDEIAVLRPVTVTIAAQTAIDCLIPTVALSARGMVREPHPCRMQGKTPPRLDPLLVYAARQPALPLQTAQLLALCLLENVSFLQWQNFSSPSSPSSPSPPRTESAMDAARILREIVPAENLALSSDPDLKRQALRTNRAKAMEFYGLSLPDTEGTAPTLGQLFHTTPDNCPACRARAKARPSPNDP